MGSPAVLLLAERARSEGAWEGKLGGPVLVQRAVWEDPRWTRAVGDHPSQPSVGEEKEPFNSTRTPEDQPGRPEKKRSAILQKPSCPFSRFDIHVGGSSNARRARPPDFRASSEVAVPLTWRTPAPYDAHAMVPRMQSGQANLTAILVLIGLVVTSVWVWKRLSLETQEYLVDRTLPLALAGLVVGAGLFVVVRKIQRTRTRRRARLRLIEAFERETVPEKKLDLAFQLIEVNAYRLRGLEAVAPALRDVLVNTLQRAVGDKQHRIRGMAASHLGVLQDMTVVPLLMKALEDGHAYVRSCAALGLGRLRALDAKERLTAMVKEDWDQTARSRAREALERLKG
jgi:hypothetical protein